MVKDGYKETEIGIIPEDWKVAILGDKVKIYRGGSPRPITRYITTSNEGVNWIKIGDVRSGEKYINATEEKIIPVGVSKSREVFVGDFILSNSMSFGRPYILNIDGCIHDGWLTIQNYTESFNREYLYYFLSSDMVLSQYIHMAAGSSVKNLNKEKVASLIVFIPTKEEQKEIAEALSDMDNLISSLEKLIEKKKAIKQACLQKMFPKDGETVPEMRLPGFTEPWEQRKVSELFKVTRSYVLATTLTGPAKTDEMPYPVYSSQTKGNGLMGYYNDYLYEDAITWTTDGANAGTVNYRAGKFYCTNVCGVLLSNEVTANQMIAEALNNVAKGYVSYVGNPKLMNNVMADIEIMIPTQAEEREKLSVFFHNLDRLITLHQRKLEKCRKIKEGMMQQLLTGKIRLALNGNTVADKNEVDTVKVSSRGHNRQFDDAVVIAGIVDKFYSDKYPLGRKKVQKLLYLFRRHQEADISAFKKKAAGPYADEVRYKGGEPIAISNKYIWVKKSSKGSSFSKGKKIGDALTYLGNWNLNDDLKWLCERFKYTKTDRLELLATIDMAMCDLTDAGIDVTVENIKNIIKSHSEWKAKLFKNYFRDNDIAWAIKECRRLFG